MTDLVTFRDEARNPIAELILCHGAGAPADSEFMATLASQLSTRGINVTRFELTYMAARRHGAKKRPPPKVELLQQEWAALLNSEAFSTESGLPVFIGGKSMGARLACMVGASEELSSKPRGVICYGYPFHPQKQPNKLRLQPLQRLAAYRMPTLILQGTRDAFGTQHEVEGYQLSAAIATHWLATADHDFKPLKSSSYTPLAMIEEAAQQTVEFITRCLR